VRKKGVEGAVCSQPWRVQCGCPLWRILWGVHLFFRESDTDTSLGASHLHDRGDNPDTNDELPGEYDLVLIAGMLGVSVQYVRELYEAGELPSPFAQDPPRWKRVQIEPWIYDNVKDRAALMLLFCVQPLDPTLDPTDDEMRDFADNFDVDFDVDTSVDFGVDEIPRFPGVSPQLDDFSDEEIFAFLLSFFGKNPDSKNPESEDVSFSENRGAGLPNDRGEDKLQAPGLEVSDLEAPDLGGVGSRGVGSGGVD